MADGLGSLVWRRFRQHRMAVAGAWALGGLILMCALAGMLEWLPGVTATRVDLNAMTLPPFTGNHLLGTDELGRDVLTRLLLGGRISLGVGVVSALLACVLGMLVGMLAGYAGGVLEAMLMRVTDAMLSIPVLPLLILLSAVDVEKLLGVRITGLGALGNVLQLVVLMVLFGWMSVARLARAATLQLKGLDYVTAARALGASHGRILLVHVLPGVLPSVVVAGTLEVGGNILYEASLSFLGLGIKPPVPSWGNMLTGAQDYMYRAPLLAVWPGLLIFITVAAFNFLGDGLRDALDPRQVMDRK